ncbi:MAG TPA: methyltransferase domain-containing protein [Stellaceae bacterium]|jgi:ubiquinone/menaquinone biosynthesis C-methylase UbiE|nr:methyltransferase domain-containing protein [Stellaceae bacterium]
MTSQFDKLAFETAQAARIGWFFGQKLLAARLSRRVAAPPKVQGRKMPDRQRLIADLWRLIERDWRNIAGGIYAVPEDWRGSPVAGLRRAVDFFADLGAVEARRHGEPGDALLREAEAERYPRYYRRKFHFQSDGYLSEASAERYDHQVEVLFGGGAAAMRRQALVPLREALRELSPRSGSVSLLDIGCGTGAFLREVKRNHPRLSVTGVDLSAPYLAVAQRRLAAWSRIELSEAAAEALPFAPESFDIISCIYLFHELPPRVRRAVVGEIRRVLKPGGTLIFVDSLQPGEEPDYDALLDYFPAAFHEPFYASYLREDLDALFSPGFSLVSRTPAYFSTVIRYRRADAAGGDD